MAKSDDDNKNNGQDDENGQGDAGTGDQNKGSGDRPDQRIKSLTSKLAETGDKLAQTEAELAKERFNNAFNQQVSKYPLAKDHASEIEEKVKKGYSVEDATISVLNSVGKLKTAEQIKADQDAEIAKKNEGKNFGGSADTTPPQGKKPIAEMTQAEKLEELKAAEARGEILNT